TAETAFHAADHAAWMTATPVVITPLMTLQPAVTTDEIAAHASAAAVETAPHSAAHAVVTHDTTSAMIARRTATPRPTAATTRSHAALTICPKLEDQKSSHTERTAPTTAVT